jgi:hypothetical protein
VYSSPGRLAKSLKDTISTGTFLKFKLDSDPHKMDTDPKTLVHGLCCTQSRYTDHHVLVPPKMVVALVGGQHVAQPHVAVPLCGLPPQT